MPSARLYRIIALFHIGIGALGLLAGVTGGIAAIAGKKDDLKWRGASSLLVLAAVVSATVAHGGWLHWRHPSRKHALVLAANTAFLAFVAALSIFDTASVRTYFDPYTPFVLIVIGYLSYRFFFKPVALRAFPSDSSEA